MPHIGIIANPPPKVMLVNLTTNEIWYALFNPTTLDERKGVKFNRLSIHGRSSERLQYQNTGNKTIPLEFFISQETADRIFGVDIPNILDDKAFLESLVHPAASIDYGYQGTPQVLFIWPNVIRMIGRVTDWGCMNRDFHINSGITTIMVARLEFEEDSDEQRLMADVRQYGGQSFRSPIPGSDIEG